MIQFGWMDMPWARLFPDHSGIRFEWMDKSLLTALQGLSIMSGQVGHEASVRASPRGHRSNEKERGPCGTWCGEYCEAIEASAEESLSP
jgi:hypothetical protein